MSNDVSDKDRDTKPDKPGPDKPGPDKSGGLARPGPVTVSAVLIMVGSAMVVSLAFSAIADLRSIENRESVQAALRQWPLTAFDLDLAGALRLIQLSATVAGGCATAAAILGGYVLRRNRGARMGLSVIGVPLLLSGLVTAGFLVILVGVAVITLWLQPARDWFDGRPPTPRGSTQRWTGHRFGAAGSPPGSASPSTWSGPDAPASRVSPGASGPGVPVSSAPVLGATLPRVDSARAGDARPGAVTAACVAAWVGSALTMVSVALSLVVLANSPDQVLAELERQQPTVLTQDVTGDMVISASFVVGGVLMVWCGLALIFATLAFRRVSWARIALLISATASAAVALFAVIGAVVLLPLLTACLLSVALLLRPEVRAWYAGGPPRNQSGG
ncbi:MAG: hypothetical protein ACRCYU_08975 [Nocardioides sp.]